jgi:hypothetical protein
MRNLIILAFVFATVLTTSCSKDEMDDFTNPENISGTTWKCTSGTYWDEDLEYALLIFTSTTAVEGWTKYVDEGEQKDWTGAFSISNDRISITYEDESFTGIIDGKTMNTTIDGGTYIFIKQ